MSPRKKRECRFVKPEGGEAPPGVPADPTPDEIGAILSVPAPLMVFDGEACVQSNEKWESLTGYSAAELRGMNICELLSDAAGRFVCPLALGEEEHPSGPRRYRVRRKDGGVSWIDWSSVRIGSNGATRHLGVAHDVTRQVEAELEVGAREAFYRSMLENATDLMAAIDEGGTVLYISPSVRRLLGLAPAELVGKSILSIVDPPDRERAREMIRRGFDNRGEEATLELGVVTRAGDVRRLQASGRAFVDHAGRPVGIINSRDISERCRVEDELRAFEARYRKFFDEDLSGAYIAAADGTIVDCNPSFASMFGFESPAEAVGGNIRRLLRENGDVDALAREVLRHGRIEGRETRMTAADGREVHVVMNVTGSFDHDGLLTGYTGYLHDETKRRAAEAGLMQAQKMESLGTLASGIAHDFNNILSIVLGHTGLIRKTDFEPKRLAESADAIEKATMRGATLVRQLLMFARKSDAAFESVRLGDLLGELLGLIRQTFPKEVDIVSAIPPDLPPITADSTQIHQVLLNLAVNARDAMSGGGVLRFAASVKPGGKVAQLHPGASAREYVSVEVSDSGTGMSEAVAARIFEPFFTTKLPGKGTGLGLSVVFGIVQTHRGFVTVETSPGRGTTFRLFFPAQERSVLIRGEESDRSEPLPGGTEGILVVEDEPMLLDLLQQVLGDRGYSVLGARDGIEALLTYREHRYRIDAVLADLGLPGIGGIELTRRLMEVNCRVRVIAASGYLDPEISADILRLGVRSVLQKPFVLRDLLTTVREVLDRKE